MPRTCYSCKTIGFVMFISTKLICVLSQEHRVMTQSCDGDWVRYGESCYRYYTSQKAWIYAFKTCQSDNGFLTDIENAEEQAFLQNLTNGVMFWIGASDCAGRWLWYGSTQPWGFTKWDIYQPDNFKKNEHCGLIRPNGMWNDRECSYTRPFVCKRKVTLSFCDKTWSTREGRCYKRFPGTLTWTKALELCQSNSATLVNIENSAEQTYVNGLYNSDHLWVGGFDGPRNKVWAWAGTTLPWNYQYWDQGEPDNGAEDCLLLARGGGLWHDVSCNRYHTVMCERNTFHLTNDPVLKMAVEAPRNETRFICTFSSNISDVDFLLEWYLNDGVIQDHTFTDETESSLHERDLPLLKQEDQIKCAVTPCMPGNCSMRGSPRESNVITAKVQVASEARITVAESSGPAYINVTSTVPLHLLCEQSHRDNIELCNAHVSIELVREREITCGRFHVPVSQAVFGMFSPHSKPCTYQMTMNTWSSGVLIPVKAALDGIKDRNQYRNIRVLFTASNVTKLISTVKLTVVDGDRVATCSSINDPHMTTFDKRYYDNYLEGEFILYKHKTLPYEVRTYYRRCNLRAACNCAVAIKSGNDVILVDVCGPSRGASTKRTIFTIKMYLNGELTPGTEVISHNGGKTFEVVLPNGARTMIMTGAMTRNQRFLNVKVVASTFDFNQTEGLCGTFDGNRNNDLMKRDGDLYTRGGKQPNEFSLSWRVSEEESLFRGDCRTTSSIAKKGIYCDCMERQTAVCQQGLDVMTCAEIQKRRGLLNGQKGVKLITQDLIQDAESPPLRCVSTRKTDSFEFDPEHMPPDPIWPTPKNITENMAKKTCEDFLGSDKAGALCTKLPGLDLNPILQGCITDIQLTDSTDWAKESLVNLLRECITIVETDTDQWSNETGEAGPPPGITNLICPNNCQGNGNCTEGLCQCFHPWIGDDCSVNSTVPPELDQVGYGEPCDAVCSECLSVRLYGENFVDVENLTCHYKVLNLRLDPISDVKTIKAAYLNSEIVKCTLPDVALYEIAVSNDGEITSEYKQYIVFNSNCHQCNSSWCTTRNNICKINGECLDHGFVNPRNQLEVCNVTLSKIQWSTLNVKDIPKKSYDFQDISGPFVLTKDSKVLVGGTGYPAITTGSSGGKALVLDGNQYLSMGDLVNTPTCFGDAEKNPLGITINLDVRLTRSASTCFVFSTGGEEVSHYGYAIWLENDSLYARASNRRHEWSVSISSVQMNEFIRIQMMWSLQSGLLLSIDNSTKVSSKKCISRPESHYTTLKEFVLGGSSKKDKNCKLTIERLTTVCASCEIVNRRDICFIERIPSVPSNSCIRSSASTALEAAVISTSVLSGISFSIICCICFIFGCKRRRKKKKRYNHLVSAEQSKGDWKTKSKEAVLNPVFLDDSGTSAYRHHWTGENPAWRMYRYEGHNQAIPHEREITSRDVKQTHDTYIPFYQETTGKVVQGFSDETSGRSFARTTHEIRTDHIEKTNHRRKTSFSANDEHGNQFIDGPLVNEAVRISAPEHETSFSLYQKSEKENHKESADYKLHRHETFTDRSQAMINTRYAENQSHKKTIKTVNTSLSKNDQSDESRYLCSYCRSHGELHGVMLKSRNTIEKNYIKDSSCQTEAYYLHSKETQNDIADNNKDKLTYIKQSHSGYQRDDEKNFLSSTNSCLAVSTSQATSEHQDVVYDVEDNPRLVVLGSMGHAIAEERETTQSRTLSAAREEIAELSPKINPTESSIELHSLDNAVYLSEKNKDKKRLSLEEQEKMIWLQSEYEENEMSSLRTRIEQPHAKYSNEATGIQRKESSDESYEIITEWIPENKMKIYTTSHGLSENYGVLNPKVSENGSGYSRQGLFVSKTSGKVDAEKINEKSDNAVGKILKSEKEIDLGSKLQDKEMISTDSAKGFIIQYANDNETQPSFKSYTAGETIRDGGEVHHARLLRHSKSEQQSRVNAYQMNEQKVFAENKKLCQHCGVMNTADVIPLVSGSARNPIQAKPDTSTIVESSKSTEMEMKPECQNIYVIRRSAAEIVEEKPEKHFHRTLSRKSGETSDGFLEYEYSRVNHRSDEQKQKFTARVQTPEMRPVVKSFQNGDIKYDVSQIGTRKTTLQRYDVNTAEKVDSSVDDESLVHYKPDGIMYRYRPCGSKEYVSDSYSFVSGSKVKEPLQGESVTTSQNRTTVVLKEDIPANERTKKVYRSYTETSNAAEVEKDTITTYKSWEVNKKAGD
nr:uncharacterized protein LOC105328884 [Crassostrea gigas]